MPAVIASVLSRRGPFSSHPREHAGERTSLVNVSAPPEKTGVLRAAHRNNMDLATASRLEAIY